ncbi:aminotransferase class I/II-fold pyridoxal phosphate-dependent enzyme [Natronorubrum daqingense]|uniref:Aminotransferase n=1 Tax=Natronorubrum daqingense TaxID=588898 RepID=A0A1N7CFS1_9EURY|nr:aminotransferase class I/II-fold pyridoxal phosphate-dependent enzyme [Natronorubrum daqingense]APX96884.1 threonine-phosphate decarboxylase [Natronorubrum daqingense]SIR62442.1 L-threonine O-3-phosphate decarboxylase [Natronorubrum daqingense]
MDPESIHTGERVPHGGEPDQQILDFSANTNPNTPAGVSSVYEDALEESRRYPDDEYSAFRAAAAEFVDCEPDQVIPTPGGLAAIRLAMESALEPGETAVLPAPSFGEYAREVHLQGATPEFVAHDELLAVPAERLETHSLAVVCTPNNPTGEAADPDALAAFAARCGDSDTTLLVDEAFLGFTTLPSAATLEAEHVIVARSLTKLFGLPGLRAGFAVASGQNRDALETARRAWSLGTPAARVGAFCLRQDEFVRDTRERVERERERLREHLEGRFDVSPSDAPYLLCAVDDRGGNAERVGDAEAVSPSDADDAVEALVESARAEGVAIRDATTFRGLDSHVRVAIKDRESNDRLLEALGCTRGGGEPSSDVADENGSVSSTDGETRE